MSNTLKNILIVIAAILIYVLALTGFHIYDTHKQAAFEQQIAELSNANAELKFQLVQAENDLAKLSQQHTAALELVQSSDLVIQDLKESVSSAGSTIKEIREQQQRIRSAVLELLNEYNDLTTVLDGKSDE